MRVVIIYCIYFQSGCIVDASCNHILYIFFSLAVLWMRVVIIYCIYFQSGCIVDASCNHILYISSVWLYCGCEL